MEFIENLLCGCEECHFNHDKYCYRKTVTMDIGGTCEDMETCDDYECSECEFFDFCTKEKKYNSSAFAADESLFPPEE